MPSLATVNKSSATELKRVKNQVTSLQKAVNGTLAVANEHRAENELSAEARAYHQEAEAKLEKMQSQLTRLQADIKEASADVKLEIIEQLQDAEVKIKSCKQELQELSDSAGKKHWKEFSESLTQMIDQLAGELDELAGSN